MRHREATTTPILILMCLWIWGCSSSLLVERDISAYRDQVQELRQRLLRNPDDTGALQELGAIYLTSGFYTPGREILERALAQAPDDSRTRFYLGAAYEALSDSMANPDSIDLDRRALQMYEDYANASERYRKPMRARYLARSRELARREVRILQRAEQRLGQQFSSMARDLSATTVGVYALIYQGANEEYRPLGRGLSEMITVDLSKIDRLTVVERVRLQALLDEQALAGSELFDQSTAPRRGLLIGAGTVVGGTFNLTDDNRAEMNVVPFDIVSGKNPSPVNSSDTLERLFQMEKEVVLLLLEEMGIELTEEEITQIQRFPTRNLQAFLAFSRGLVQEDAQQFDAAAASFKQAVALDPGFDLAAESADNAGILTEGGIGLENVLGLDVRPDGDLSGFQNITNLRLRNQGETIDATIVPGPEQREGTIDYLLPPPPPPPPPQNRQP